MVNLRHVFIETVFLLLSSYACGLGALSAELRQPGRYLIFAALTFVLGARLPVHRDLGFCRHGEGRGCCAVVQRLFIGFLTPRGHARAHVTSGLLWLVYMVAQVAAKGLRPHVLRRLLCFSLFWHALDIIWIGVLTVVYLMGAR